MHMIIVEDELSAKNELEKHISAFSAENNMHYSLDSYDNAVSFLENYKADADIIFMDIRMPKMTGMAAAAKLREIDKSVILIFVTDMVQYAVDGYAVNALDFIVKPISYTGIENVLKKAKKLIINKDESEIVLKNKNIVKRVPTSEILFIEVHGHKLTYHTVDGRFDDWGALDEIAGKLTKEAFSRCNVAYLVGLKHVRTIDGEEVIVGEHRLKISRNRRKEFFASFAKYLGKSI